MAERAQRWLVAFAMGLFASIAGAQTLDATIAGYAATHEFSGTIRVRRAGETLYRHSFGAANRAFEVAVDERTRFRIASITKLFTATLILMLERDGKLDLDAPIARYLPDYRGPAARRVTIRQLLNHTSGIANSDTVKSYEDAATHGIAMYQLPHTPAELVSRYASGRLVHAPGTHFDYNNADYFILGRIIEQVGGVGYDVALKQRILDPLGMTSTGLPRQEDILPGLADAYFRPGPGQALINDMPTYIQNWYAAGGMVASADDLVTFADALFGARLLGADALRRLLEPGLDDYGYGLWIASTKIDGTPHRFAHRPGRIMGANAVLLRYLDDDLTIVILANTNLADIDEFAFTIGKAVIAKH